MDEKFRVAIPARFRDQLAKWGQSDLYAVARENHIVLFPQDAWEKFVERLLSEDNPPHNAQHYDYLRRQVALSGEICRLDSQGRIMLRPDQLQAAGVSKECQIFGNMRVLELWSPKAFEGMAQKALSQDENNLWLEIVQSL
ncbi:MAG: hypothetical protein KJ970_18815 [Candidatus Eisenbacteria bacterium]|uniref:Transcriptional regulator MraZ n=1 Tax=Eiseniibacteriota bacterium TaxID=2212470 RepID=A0A948RXR3_UNCEI|nr:hypothetical protein [Candidatus Eisenbacteria bacterium]